MPTTLNALGSGDVLDHAQSCQHNYRMACDAMDDVGVKGGVWEGENRSRARGLPRGTPQP